MSKKRTEIIIETERLTIVRGPRPAAVWCEVCGQTSRMLTVDQAAVISGASSRLIFRLIEAGSLHFSETNGGLLRVCEAAIRKHRDWLRGLARRGPLTMTLPAITFMPFLLDALRDVFTWLAERFLF